MHSPASAAVGKLERLRHNPGRWRVGAKGIAQGSGIPVGSLHSPELSRGESWAQGGLFTLREEELCPSLLAPLASFLRISRRAENTPPSFDFTPPPLPTTTHKHQTRAAAPGKAPPAPAAAPGPSWAVRGMPHSPRAAGEGQAAPGHPAHASTRTATGCPGHGARCPHKYGRTSLCYQQCQAPATPILPRRRRFDFSI